MMRPYKLLPTLFLIFLSCSENVKQGNLTKADENSREHSADTTEMFETFNRRFHIDSAFQLSRIAFPINGRYVDGENSYAWTTNNWELLKKPVKQTAKVKDYKHSLQKTDTTVVEK